MTIRALLIEDDQDWIEGIKSSVEQTEDIVLIGAVPSLETGLEIIRHLQVDIILLDVFRDQERDEIRAINDIKDTHPEAKIIMLSSVEEDQLIWEAYVQGIENYIVKSAGYELIPSVIRDAFYNRSGIHSTSAKAIRRGFKRLQQQYLNKLLTPQERKILSYVYMGKTTSDIRTILTIEEKTIDNHITSINRKLQVKNRKQAAQVAMAKGLLVLDDIMDEASSS